MRYLIHTAALYTCI